MSIDELIDDARELKLRTGRLPSKNALQKTLRVGWDKVSQVHQQLAAEDAERATERRMAMRRLATRKNPRFKGAATSRVLPAPVSPAVAMTVVEPIPAPAVGVSEEPVVEATEVFPASSRRVATWPLQLIALPAYVAIWAGWVALGGLTGFGPINLLPGFTHDGEPLLVVNTAITLPIGAEAYAAYALYVLFHTGAPARARKFAAWSSGAALLIGMGGQVAYHLMAAEGIKSAPWQITTFVSCLPVAVLGAAAALVHLVRAGEVKS